ncbi:ABC-type dipeptide/oligopeptide/nickel transport system ATPase component [Kribbella steppae]|uniref:ABC-type dipeptide/oligopeptide/nickel transport system ATPase component n=1 Tax=Kribbella steppae TaxID=2512223 RepID=A0A4V2S0V6_9ACTN|nr:ABC transporter ATP-binding protein [Kribbella steppae]TCO34200.1 ABC-type dipeptide/oligopeptide/nickel transport system ATPase component [Kribbella steppae]
MTTLLEISDLKVSVRTTEILRGISVTVEAGETVGLVGESGSGKSTTARAALKLFPDQAATSGAVVVGGTDLLTCPPAEVQDVRANHAAMIFQAPRTALNPVRRIGDSATERLVQVHGVRKNVARGKLVELFGEVGLRDPERLLRLYPHQLSGGMLQRVVIAAALSIDPRLLLADEATSALDVTTQAEVLALLRRLRAERDLGVLFITHDLHLAAAYCDRVYVMKDGLIVDHQPGQTIFENPVNEYTRALAAAVPKLPDREEVPT